MFDYDALKKYLDDNGLKQNFIAQKIGTSASMFSAILSGRVVCSLENYINICRVLGIPFGSFINADAPDNVA